MSVPGRREVRGVKGKDIPPQPPPQKQDRGYQDTVTSTLLRNVSGSVYTQLTYLSRFGGLGEDENPDQSSDVVLRRLREEGGVVRARRDPTVRGEVESRNFRSPYHLGSRAPPTVRSSGRTCVSATRPSVVSLRRSRTVSSRRPVSGQGHSFPFLEKSLLTRTSEGVGTRTPVVFHMDFLTLKRLLQHQVQLPLQVGVEQTFDVVVETE